MSRLAQGVDNLLGDGDSSGFGAGGFGSFAAAPPPMQTVVLPFHTSLGVQSSGLMSALAGHTDTSCHQRHGPRRWNRRFS